MSDLRIAQAIIENESSDMCMLYVYMSQQSSGENSKTALMYLLNSQKCNKSIKHVAIDVMNYKSSSIKDWIRLHSCLHYDNELRQYYIESVVNYKRKEGAFVLVIDMITDQENATDYTATLHNEYRNEVNPYILFISYLVVDDNIRNCVYTPLFSAWNDKYVEYLLYLSIAIRPNRNAIRALVRYSIRHRTPVSAIASAFCD
jgi:hypothetical protein